MKQITFIKVQDLKDNSIIQSNVDEKILNQSIIEFQELELEPLLGQPLYRRLSNEIVSATTITGYTLSNDDSELLRYIKPFMVYGALINSLNPLHYKVTNKGVQKLNDDSSQNADRSDIEALKSSYQFKKDAYKKRLTDYMNTDNSEETEVPLSVSDTSFSFTGISIEDNAYDWESAYRDSVYKTGYYRRMYY